MARAPWRHDQTRACGWRRRHRGELRPSRPGAVKQQPPRLVARTMGVIFATVAVILLIVFIVLVVDARDRVRAGETAKLDVSARVFTAFEARREQDQNATIATLAEAPMFKAALDTYATETLLGTSREREQQLRRTMAPQLERLADATTAQVLAVLDTKNRVFASAGGARQRWPVGERVQLSARGQTAFQGVAVVPSGAFRVSGAALRVDDRDVGTLVLGTALDDAYARVLANLSQAGIVITVNGGVVARTVPADVTRDLLAAEGDPGEARRLDRDE